MLRGFWLVQARGMLFWTSALTATTILTILTFPDSTWPLIPIVVAWLCMPHAYILAPWLHFRAVLRHPPCDSEGQLTFSDNGVHLKDRYADSQCEWAVFTRFIEGRSLFVLVLGRRGFIAIPKGVFASDTDRAQFRDMARRSAGAQRQGSS